MKITLILLISSLFLLKCENPKVQRLIEQILLQCHIKINFMHIQVMMLMLQLFEMPDYQLFSTSDMQNRKIMVQFYRKKILSVQRLV